MARSPERCSLDSFSEARVPNDPSIIDAADETQSFLDWLAQYSVGRIGPADVAPAPPPCIVDILRDIGDDSEHASPARRRSRSSSRASASGSTSTRSTESVPPSPVPPAPPCDGPISFSFTLSHGSHRDSDNASTASSMSFANPAVSDEVAAGILRQYRETGMFPAPPGPWEQERLMLAHKYGLDQSVRRRAIDRICALAKTYFKTKMVVVSLTMDDQQLLGAERGFATGPEPGLDDPLTPLSIEPAFCTHAMAASYKDPNTVFVVADANKDWRFKRNPYATRNGGGVSFYAAANVNLPVGPDARKRGLPETLASGALCLMDPTKQLKNPSDFSDEDRAVLTDLAEMIAREFQLGFEQRRREAEAKQSEFLGSFLQQALVLPCQPDFLRPIDTSPGSSQSSSPRTTNLETVNEAEGEPTTRNMEDHPFDFSSTPDLSWRKHGSSRPAAASQPNESHAPHHSSTDPTLGPSLFHVAATNLVNLTRARSCAILDLRGFRSTYYRAEASVLRSSVSLSPTAATSPRVPTSPSSLHEARRAPGTPGSRKRTESYGVGVGRASRGKIGLLADVGDVDWTRIVKRSSKLVRNRSELIQDGGEGLDGDEEDEQIKEDALTLAVEETLHMYSAMPHSEVESLGFSGAFSAFEILPASTSDTVCVPVFDVDGSPALMIVMSSTEKWFRFEPPDRRFAQSIGAIIIGALLRERAQDSDRAKLAFISQVSHELRTPLHGINSQLELIREFSSPPELRKLSPLLDVADVCLESLSDVLNDTLDFSKLSNNSMQESASLQLRSLTETDLASLVEGVMMSTWVKKRRTDLATLDLGSVPIDGRTPLKETGAVDLILEVSEKDNGWEVMTDVPGLKRVLLNIVGNALKFTKTGHVRVTLRYLGDDTATSPASPRSPIRPQLAPDKHSYRGYVAIIVQDTGVGMSADFLRDGQMFVPFKQADPFASGAGLGLSICDSIVKRMDGRIDVSSQVNVGTEIAVSLPLDFVTPAPTSGFPFTPAARERTGGPTTRRVISDELNKLLGSGPPELPSTIVSTHASSRMSSVVHTPQTPGTPGDVRPTARDIAFSDAVAAVQASMSTPLGSPVLERREPNLAAAVATQDDLAIEAAKLALTTSHGIESTMLPMISPVAVAEQAMAACRKVTEQAHAAALNNAPSTVEPEIVKRRVDERRKASVAPDCHVLCADDNPVARNILIKLFTGKGVEFSAAEDGQQAVDMYIAGGGKIPVAFLDIQMPNKDGLEAAHEIRQIERERGWHPCRIIALTGLSNEADMAKALGPEGSIDKWLVKGGKSLRIIMDEVVEMQRELEACREAGQGEA
ncbi:hypothetical protein JCM10212_002183 [Sporobolomyces blumeae]